MPSRKDGQLLIEPVWNGNAHGFVQMGISIVAFNRTSLEWKYAIFKTQKMIEDAFNRTSLEWKLPQNRN